MPNSNGLTPGKRDWYYYAKNKVPDQRGSVAAPCFISATAPIHGAGPGPGSKEKMLSMSCRCHCRRMFSFVMQRPPSIAFPFAARQRRPPFRNTYDI
jgi:hypothetical protein